MQLIIWHGIYEVQPDDFVIYSGATSESPEVQTSLSYIGKNHKKVFPPLSYFQFLGEISKYLETIAIAGTHGKSTTTALTAHALSQHYPMFGIGIVWAGVADRWWDNVRVSTTHTSDIKDIIHHIIDPKWPSIEHLMKKYLFVIEACEYNYQFLSLDVDYAALTNIELDHADVYGTFANYLDTFVQFCGKVKKWIFSFGDTQWLETIQDHSGAPLHMVQQQHFKFAHMLWAHNHLNASLALSICERLTRQSQEDRKSELPLDEGVELGEASEGGLKTTIQWFTSLRRRWELLWHNTHWVPVITDYAHHPTELASILKAVQEKYTTPSPSEAVGTRWMTESEMVPWGGGSGWGQITLIFQPHQARRVVEFWDEFVDTLQTVDHPIIYNIYTARESMADLADYTISSTQLQSEVWGLRSFDELGELFVDQCDGTYITDYTQIQHIISQQTEWVILVCTAGDLDWEVRKFIDHI